MLSVPAAPTAIELPIAPLSRLLPTLGRKWGRRLQPSVAMRHHVLFLRPRTDTDPDLFLAEIARTTFAKWVPEADGTLRLVQDPDARRAQRAVEAKIVRDAWEKTLARRREAANGPPPDWRALATEWEKIYEVWSREEDYGAIAQRDQAAKERQPAGRLMSRIIAALPADLFTEAHPVGIAFADRPGPGQRAFPAAALTAIRSWAGESAAWQDEKSRRGLRDRAEKAKYPTWHELAIGDPVPDRIGYAVLRFSDSDEKKTLRLRVFDDRGALLASFDQSLAPTFSELPKIPEPVPVLPHSTEARQHAGYWFGGDRDFTEATRARIRDVLKLDPQAGPSEERYASWADWRGKPAIALLDPAAMPSTTGPTYRVAQAEENQPLRERNGILVLSPLTPLLEEGKIASREELARELAFTTRPGRRTLEEVCEGAFRLRDAPSDSLLRTLVRNRSRNSGGVFERTVGDWHVLYAALRPAQRKSGEAGVPFRELTPEAKGVLLRGLYSATAFLLPMREGAFYSGTVPPERYEQEPTVRWPLRTPVGRLKVTESTEEVIQRAPESTNKRLSMSMTIMFPESPEAYGASLARRSREPGANPDHTDRVRAERKRQIVLTFLLDGGGELSGTIEDVQTLGDYGPPSALPREIRERVQKARHPKPR